MTATELFALPTNDRIDRRLIRGRLVERPYPFRCPAHAATTANLCSLLLNWERSPAGAEWVVYGYGCPYRLRRDPDTLLCFDVSITAASLDAVTPARAQFIDGRPSVAIEILDLSDPDDAPAELIDIALTSGVSMVWFVDPFEDTVEVHRPGAGRTILGRADVLDANDVIPGFRCRVAAIFE